MKFYVLTGRGLPIFIEDEDGNPAEFDSKEKAEEVLRGHTMCRAFGGVIIVWEEGFVDVEE